MAAFSSPFSAPAPAPAPEPPPVSEIDEVARKKRLRRLIITIVLASVGVHLAVGVVAGIIVVARYLNAPPAVFQVVKDVRISAKQREHKMAMRDFDSMAPKPSFSDRMQSVKPAPFSLPDLPKVPMDQALPLDPEMIVSPIVGAGGNGNGNGYGDGRGGSKANFNFQMSFFGIKDTGRSVLILIDTSNSMFERVRKGQQYHFKFKNIKDEAMKLINSMNINALFNVVIYEGGAMAFSAQSMPATDANKAAARDWVMNIDENPSTSISGRRGGGPKLMEGGGTRLDTGFKMAFKMQPDLIFLITDGEINRGEEKMSQADITGQVKELQKELKKARGDDSDEAEAKIHVIQYMTTVAKADEVQTLQAIARQNHGRYRTIKAEETKD